MDRVKLCTVFFLVQDGEFLGDEPMCYRRGFHKNTPSKSTEDN